MAQWRGRLGTPTSGRHSGPQGRGRFIAVRFHGTRVRGTQLCGRSAIPMYGSRRTLGFPPRSNHLGTEGPSRRPPAAGCAGRRPAFQAGPRRLPYRGSRRDGSYPGGRGSSRRPPTAGCAGLKTGVPSRPRAPAPAAMRGFRCHRSPALLRAIRPPSNQPLGGQTRCAPARCPRRSRTSRTAGRERCTPRRPRR